MAIFYYSYPAAQPNVALPQYVLNDIWVSQNGAPVQLTYNAVTKKNAWTKYSTTPLVSPTIPTVVSSTLVSSKSITKNQSTTFVPVTAYGGSATATSYTTSGTVSGLTVTISPALPAGLTLSTALTVKSVIGSDSVPRLYNSVNVTISGTPTVVITNTTYSVTFTDASGLTSTSPFDLTVVSGVAAVIATQSVSSKSLTKSVVATAFTPVTGSGGEPPLTYSISPSLPTGLSFNATTGEITGTPTDALTVTPFTVTVTDSTGQYATNTFSLTVANPPSLVLSQAVTSKNLTQNATITAFTPISATNGYGTLVYSISPTLPAGLSFNTVSGEITGTPTVSSAVATYTVTITDAVAQTVNASFTLSVTPAQIVTVQSIPSKTLTRNIVASAFTPVTASGGTGTLLYSISPTLPTGLSFNTSNGLISGTPTLVSALVSYTVTVTDTLAQTSSKTFSLTVNAPLTLTTTQSVATKSLSQNLAATAFTPVTATGGEVPLVFAISPGLPAGLTFSSSTGQIAGTPSAASIATTYTITVTDAAAQTSSKTFILTVDAVSLTTTLAVPTTVLIQNNLATSFTPVTGSGGIGTLVYAISPTLPTGLTFSTNNGLVSGTPTVISAATNYTITVTDSNNIPQSSSKTFNLTVNPKAVVTVQAVPSTVLTQNITITPFIPVTGSGGTGTLTYALNTLLPTGLNFNTATGQISGTPGVAFSIATYTVTVTDSNSVPQSSSKTFNLTVSALPALTTTLAQATATLTQNTAATAFIPVTGAGGYGTIVYSINPTLPTGLSFNTANGQITGTPSILSGTTNYTVTVTDGALQASNKIFSLTVNAGPIVTTALLVNQTLTQNVLATTFKPVNGTGGYGTLAYSVSPDLPLGLSLNASSGSITGTPTVVQGQTTYTITVTDSVPQTSSKTFTLTIEAPPAVSTVLAVPTSALTINVAPIAFTPVTASGGYGTLVYAISAGLPAGLLFSTSTGQISGTPSIISSSTSYTVSATDSLAQFSSKAFTLSVGYPELITTRIVASKSITQNVDIVSFTPVVASGGYGTLVYSVGPSLPSGLVISTSTGLITGTATVSSATATYVIGVTDSVVQFSGKSFTLYVAPEPPPPLVFATLSTSSYAFVQNVAVTTFTPVVGSGGKGTLSYSIDVGLPSGLTFITATGQILGTPTVTSSTATYTITVTDSVLQTASRTFTIYVAAPPPPPALIVTATIATKTLTQNVTAAAFIPVTASGGVGTYAFSVSPSLPTGLTFLSTNGQIIGTPSSTSSTTTYSVTVADTVSQHSTATFNLNVVAPPLLTTTISNAGFVLSQNVVISPFSPVTTSGGYGVLTYTISPTLPSGVSFNSVTGQITGTPTAYTANIQYTVTVSDQATQTSSKTFGIAVIPPALTVTSVVSSSTFIKGVTVTAVTPVTATGGYTPYVFGITPSVPAGLLFSTATGQLSGKATTSTVGVVHTISVTDTASVTSSTSYTLTVNNPPALVTVQDVPTVNLTRFIDVANVSPVSASGGYGTISFAITPTLPSGLNFNTSNGKITGTATQLNNQTYLITAADSLGQTSGKTFSLVITDLPLTTTQLIAVSTLTQTKAVVAFKPVNGIGGVPPLVYSTVPSLQSGLVINASTGYISGTPSTVTGGTVYSVVVTDSVLTSNSSTFTLVVEAPPVVVTTLTTSSVSATVNQSISPAIQPVLATYGYGNVRYGISPTLPTGAIFNTSTGYISGTPTVISTSQSYTITATDELSQSSSKSFTFAVVPSPIVITVPYPTVAMTQYVQVTTFIPVVGSGGYGTLSYGITPALATGLSFNNATGEISGTPTDALGDAVHSITVTDSTGQRNTGTTSIVISDSPPPALVAVLLSSYIELNLGELIEINPVTGSSGYGTYSYAISPSQLPAGLTFNSTTGAIAGTPTAATSSTGYTVTITDGVPQSINQAFNLAVIIPVITQGKGYTGSRGYTGSIGAGYTGSRGSAGINGYTGSAGSLGYTGSVGIGYIGSIGSAGYTGSNGYTGSIGYTGSAGVIGNTGYTGSIGELGYTGSIGYSGSKGDIGYSGSIGYTGSIGNLGYTGSIGVGYTGSRGTDGTSVTILGTYYDLAALAVAHPTGSLGDGYILSSNGHLAVWNGAEWVDVGSITGPQGEAGFAGSSGYTGSVGFVGSVGRDGYTGSIGQFGYIGSGGYTGSKGYTGSTGVGYTGSTGPQGIQGPPGTGSGGGFFGNFDGGQPDSNYGGITSIDAGGVSG